MYGCRIVSNSQERIHRNIKANKRTSLYIPAEIRLPVISEEEEIPLSTPSLPPMAGGGEGWDDLLLLLKIRMQADITHLAWSHFEQKMEAGTDFAIFMFEKMDFRLY
jgi:hypothetical protein